MSGRPSRPARRAALLPALLSISLALAVPSPVPAQSRQPTGAEDVPTFILPHRTGLPSPVVAPPEVPATALRIAPATLTVATVGASAGPALVHTVTRTADRVHVDTGGGREWLYVRNPVDARRVSASRVDHTARTIVVYDESDLRNAMGIRGWLDVLTLGFDAAAIEQLSTAPDPKPAFGLIFEHLTATASDTEVRDVWWSRAEYLPLEVVRRRPGGAEPIVVTIRDRRTEIIRPRLEAPTTRFPAYRQMDYPDWLEGLHER